MTVQLLFHSGNLVQMETKNRASLSLGVSLNVTLIQGCYREEKKMQKSLPQLNEI
jgi:hypothetical protein